MDHLKNFAFLCLLLFIVQSCEKDESIDTNENFISNVDLELFSQNFGATTQGDFLGVITNKNSLPLEGVSITIGTSNTTTDTNGVFVITNASINTRFAYIKAEKEGFISASRSVVPSTGTNKIKIMMLPINNVSNISSGTPETVSLSNGSSLELKGDYIDQNGNNYSGSVSVSMHYLNPEDDDIALQMPGMLYGANSENDERLLRTFGMLAIELRGENDEDLNIAQGSNAQISVPIPQSLLNDAPASIPLWSFNETYGVWVEEGIANLENGNYVGTVSHFSFWNYDIAVETVNFCSTFVDDNGNPLSNLHILITSPTIGSSGGITNENGEVCGLVPANDALVISAGIQDTCGFNSFYETDIGPFNADTNLDFTISDTSLPEIITETVTGIFVNCNQEFVTDGYVKLSYGDVEVIDIVTDGTFEITFYRCDESTNFTLTGIDFTDSQSTDTINYNFSTPTTDIGPLASCVNYAFNFLNFQVGDYPPVQQIEAPFPISLNTDSNFRCNDGEILKTGYSIQSFDSNFIFLDFNNFNGVGIYSGDNGVGDFDSSESFTNMTINGMIQLGDGLSQPRLRNFVGTAEVLTFGEVGEIVEISFSGTIDVFQANGVNLILIEEDVPTTGFMHLIRDM
ncbi:carboxypeptidase-like regulatory domain-containing protein [Winogradskyella maritima]|uniref:Carboxypeptidase-like regulatory domain-containing protein n=1 Tax=Winogradskyella maritima TaxID=1517766 RepID=A0ABV8AGW4_9FLAO|nr:carboxypeptidase-like regulatory domain-containing protein [Winogradskyella maritima]